jgi:hypothetical protein
VIVCWISPEGAAEADSAWTKMSSRLGTTLFMFEQIIVGSDLGFDERCHQKDTYANPDPPPLESPPPT